MTGLLSWAASQGVLFSSFPALSSASRSCLRVDATCLSRSGCRPLELQVECRLGLSPFLTSATWSVDGLGDLSLAGRVGIDVKELGWWWDVWWGGSVERFLDVFRPSCSLLLLTSYGISVLNFDRAAGVSVLPKESSGDLVEPVHVSLVYCSLCLWCQLLYLSSFVFPGTFSLLCSSPSIELVVHVFLLLLVSGWFGLLSSSSM